MRHCAEHPLPEPLFEAPEIGRLAHKGGANIPLGGGYYGYGGGP